MKKYLLIVLATGFLASCVSKGEYEKLSEERNLLQAELENTEKLNSQITSKMDEVDVLLDSIEASDQSLSIQLEKGTSYSDYSSRLQNINNVIENSKNKIAEMEKLLEDSDAKNSSLGRMVSKLRSSIEQKEARIAELNQQVEKYKTENASLIKTVDLQSRELKEREMQIQLKKEELEKLQADIEEANNTIQDTKATLFYDQAEAMVEAADRTKFAPKKKKETYKEAYELYKQAFEAGNKEAFAKMEALEKKM